MIVYVQRNHMSMIIVMSVMIRKYINDIIVSANTSVPKYEDSSEIYIAIEEIFEIYQPIYPIYCKYDTYSSDDNDKLSK